MAGCHLCDHITNDYDGFLLLVLRKTIAMSGRPKWKGAEGRLQSRNGVSLMSNSSLFVLMNNSSSRIDCCHQPREQGHRSFPSQASDVTASLAALLQSCRAQKLCYG